MQVRDWMTTEVVCVSGTTSIGDAAALMKERRIRHLPVMERTELIGIISDRDVREVMPSHAASTESRHVRNWLDKARVRDIMTRRVVGVSPDVSIAKAAGLMCRNKIGCLPVLDRGALIGIITESDILRAVAEDEVSIALSDDASRSQGKK